MSHSRHRSWLIAYDIRDPRRLVRVHRFLKQQAIPVQYSVFILRGTQTKLESILIGIQELIASAVDDVRAYHLPDECQVNMLGRQSFPGGIMVGSLGLDRLLTVLTESDDLNNLREEK